MCAFSLSCCSLLVAAAEPRRTSAVESPAAITDSSGGRLPGVDRHRDERRHQRRLDHHHQRRRGLHDPVSDAGHYTLTAELSGFKKIGAGKSSKFGSAIASASICSLDVGRLEETMLGDRESPLLERAVGRRDRSSTRSASR